VRVQTGKRLSDRQQSDLPPALPANIPRRLQRNRDISPTRRSSTPPQIPKAPESKKGSVLANKGAKERPKSDTATNRTAKAPEIGNGSPSPSPVRNKGAKERPNAKSDTRPAQVQTQSSSAGSRSTRSQLLKVSVSTVLSLKTVLMMPDGCRTLGTPLHSRILIRTERMRLRQANAHSSELMTAMTIPALRNRPRQLVEAALRLAVGGRRLASNPTRLREFSSCRSGLHVVCTIPA
jgi:hypothetical protein